MGWIQGLRCPILQPPVSASPTSRWTSIKELTRYTKGNLAERIEETDTDHGFSEDEAEEERDRLQGIEIKLLQDLREI